MKIRLTDAQAQSLLQTLPVGILSTVGGDGYPYAVPMNFVWMEGKIYMHGALTGQKLDNIARDSRVCLTACEMREIICKEATNPCKVGTSYDSVMVIGDAAVISDEKRKLEALRAIAVKYAPGLASFDIPAKSAAATCVVEITPVRITGKSNR